MLGRRLGSIEGLPSSPTFSRGEKGADLHAARADDCGRHVVAERRHAGVDVWTRSGSACSCLGGKSMAHVRRASGAQRWRLLATGGESHFEQDVSIVKKANLTEAKILVQ